MWGCLPARSIISKVSKDPVCPSFHFASKADLPCGPVRAAPSSWVNSLAGSSERSYPSKHPESRSDWTNPGHVPTPEPITAAKGRVCVDWLGLGHLLHPLEPGHGRQLPYNHIDLPWEGDAGRYQHVATEGHRYPSGRVIMGIRDNVYEAHGTQ